MLDVYAAQDDSGEHLGGIDNSVGEDNLGGCSVMHQDPQLKVFSRYFQIVESFAWEPMEASCPTSQKASCPNSPVSDF